MFAKFACYTHISSIKEEGVSNCCHELWINVWNALLHMNKANLYHWSSRELLPFWIAHSWQSSVTVNPGIGDTIYCKRGSCERRCLQFCCLCSSTFLPQAMAEVPVNSEQFWAPNLLLNLLMLSVPGRASWHFYCGQDNDSVVFKDNCLSSSFILICSNSIQGVLGLLSQETCHLPGVSQSSFQP